MDISANIRKVDIKMDTSLIVSHKTDRLYFYRYYNIEGIENRVYISEKDKVDSRGVDLNIEEFGFIDINKKVFKNTEEIYLTLEQMKDIVDYMEKMK